MIPLKYHIGKLFSRLGYDLHPSWKAEKGSLNLLDLAIRALASSREIDVILQIGAFDGVGLDPLTQTVSKIGKRIILVEPQPEAAARLRERYLNASVGGRRFDVFEAAISDFDGTGSLYSDTTCSPKASLLQGHLKNFNREATVTHEVRIIRPKTLLEECGITAIDVLQIDTEGLDWHILSAFLDQGILPEVIHYEHLHLNSLDRNRGRERLTAEGYQWREYGWDTLAVRA